MEPPEIIILSGPNGAGKTTFAYENFAELISSKKFLNADEIAKNLDIESPIEVGRKFIEVRSNFLKKRETFLIETTLASRSLLKFIKKAKEHGFKIRLYFLWVPHPELCDFRVKDRVSKGGHNIPLHIITRRYFLGLKYLNQYIAVADKAFIYEAGATPTLITVYENNMITKKLVSLKVED